MGVYLLRDLKVSLDQLDHRNFNDALKLVEQNGESYLVQSIEAIVTALNRLYADRDTLSLQRLSATFRREDLIEKLDLRVSAEH